MSSWPCDFYMLEMIDFVCVGEKDTNKQERRDYLRHDTSLYDYFYWSQGNFMISFGVGNHLRAIRTATR